LRGARLGIPEPGGQLVELTLDPLALPAGQLMVELVRQRCQRPAMRPADYDLADQMTGQLIRQHGTRHAQYARWRLAGPGEAGVIEHRQLLDDVGLQPLQQHFRPGPGGYGLRVAEDLADYHRGLPGLLTTRRAELGSGGLDGGGCGLPQRTVLLTAEDQLGQLLTARISDLLDQPGPESINYENHVSSLPATAPPGTDIAGGGQYRGYFLRCVTRSQRVIAPG
jgi:hypothetical protein